MKAEPSLELSPETLKSQLLQQQLLSLEDITELEAELSALKRERQSRAQARLYTLEDACLKVRNYASDELLTELELNPASARTPSLETWSQEWLTVNPGDGRLNKLCPVSASSQPGLLVTPSTSYLHLPGFEGQITAARSEIWRNSRRNKFKADHGPYDLQISPDRRFLFVTDRAAGSLLVISTDSHALLARLEIRSPGSSKAIHVAVDGAQDRAFITDNESSHLRILNLKNFKLRSFPLGFGVLGNLLLDKNPRFLYLLTLKPNTGFKYIDTDKLELIKEIGFHGKLLSKDLDVPSDPLMMTPDHRHVLLLSYRDEPQPYTPVVNVYETSEVRPVLRYALKARAYPTLISSEALNPFSFEAPDLRTLLLHKGLLSREQLAQLEQLETLSQQADSESTDALDPTFFEIPAPNPDSPDEQLQRMSKLPKEAEEEIQAYLLTLIHRETGLQLRDYRVEMKRLEELAFQIRQDLESNQRVQVNKYHYFFNHYSVSLPFFRDSLIKLLDWRKGSGDGKATPAYRCPSCSGMLLGRWNCSRCGFKLVHPNWLKRRAIASIETDTLALPGEMVIPLEHKLLLFNPAYTCIWQYDLSEAGLRWASDVRVLQDQHLLVCDSSSARVVELSVPGQPVWEAKVALSRPVKATWFRAQGQERLLIADTGLKQVLAINRANDILWSYGGPDSDALREPVSIQHTHRNTVLISDRGSAKVLEVDEHGVLQKTFGASLGLKQPVYARLQLNNQLLIVDAGSQEMLTLDEDGVLISRLNYQALADEAGLKLGLVNWVTQALSGEVLLSDGRHLLSVDPDTQQTRQAMSLEGLSPTPQIIPDSDKLFLPPNPLEQRLAFLEEQPIYRGLSKDALLMLAQAMMTAGARAGEKIVIEGDKGSAMYTILQGTVQVFKAGHDDVVSSLHSGDTFGEMALYFLEERSATVIAKTDCYLLRLDHGPFRKAMNSFPELGSRFHELCMRRKRILHQHKVGLYQEAVEQLKARIALTRMRKLKLFQAMEPAVFEALKDRLYCVSYPRNHYIFRPEAPVRHLYFVSRGSVEVLGDNERLMTTLPEGEVFGEIALLKDRARTASVRTKGYCELYQLDKEALFNVLENHPDLKEHLSQLAETRFERDPGVAAEEAPTNSAEKTRVRTQSNGRRSGESGRIYGVSLETREVIGLGASGQIEWSFGGGDNNLVLNPCRVSADGDTLLITDSGQNRILEVDILTKAILQEFGDEQLELYNPSSAVYTSTGNVLICDQGSEAIIEVDALSGESVWRFDDPQLVLSPIYAEHTHQDTILYVDDSLHQVVEITRDHQPVWVYGELMVAGSDPGQLQAPTFATRLSNGHTLIADTGNHRILEVNSRLQIVWQFAGTSDQALNKPTWAQRLSNGNTLIGFDWQTQLIEIDPLGQILWQTQLQQPSLV